MADGAIANLKAQAEHDAWNLPLAELNPAQPALFQADTIWPFFERLRKEDPVHYTAEHEFGPYWSVTKYNDIMAVDTNHEVFSSEPAASPSPSRRERLPRCRCSSPWTRPSTTCSARRSARPSRRPTWPGMEPLIRERAGADPRRPADRRGRSTGSTRSPSS